MGTVMKNLIVLPTARGIGLMGQVVKGYIALPGMTQAQQRGEDVNLNDFIWSKK